MSNKTRNIIKAIAVILVLVAVLMHLGFISIYFLSYYKFWLAVIAFGLMLLASK
ncbi:hypothetical protein [Pseudochryseolinea flava]|uniref:hypothetical protein n=1 Tax=Pseudochryseolinea flava TaxID=2059302 RepID=UPI0014041BA6|nr:hypothetical protein [Pseudochryseolinea flava]